MRATKEKPVSPQQLKALHACFRKAGMDEENRHNYIHHFTSGRTDSTKELTFDEARRILTAFNSDRERMLQKEAAALLRAIYFLSTRISFLNKDYPAETEADYEMNKAKIDVFCRQRSKCRKNIRQMNVEELREVKKQLEAIARKENE